MNAAEIVVHHRKRDGVLMVLDFLAESVGQSGKSAVAHAPSEVGTLNVAGRNQIAVGRPATGYFVRSNADRRAVFAGWLGLVLLNQHGVIHVTAKGAFNGVSVGRMTVRSQLYAGFQPAGKVGHKPLGSAIAATSDVVRGNQFGIGVQRNPEPNIAHFTAPAHWFGNVRLFLAAKCPDFVNLQNPTIQAVHDLVMIFGAGLARRDQQPLHGFLGRARQTRRASHAASLNQTVEDLRPFFNGQRLHKIQS